MVAAVAGWYGFELISQYTKAMLSYTIYIFNPDATKSKFTTFMTKYFCQYCSNTAGMTIGVLNKTKTVRFLINSHQ